MSSLHPKSSVQPQFPDNTRPLITHYQSLSQGNVKQILTAQTLVKVLPLEILDKVWCNAELTGRLVFSW